MNAFTEQLSSTQQFQPLRLHAHLSGSAEDFDGHGAAQATQTERATSWKLKRILVPTDFSTSSARALARAAEFARSHNATLTLLHVIDVNPPAARTHCGTAAALMRQLWDRGISELSRLTKFLAQSRIKAHAVLVEGIPVETIVENSSGPDLLIIGEQRPKHAWSLFSRHTARRVIDQAACPVLVVHGEAARAKS